MSQYAGPVTRPAAYPTELERELALDDGRTVLVRPVVPEDAPMLQRQMGRADPDTIYQRFFRYPVQLDPATVDRLTRLDYQGRLALAAFTPEGEGIAIARYEATDPGSAEVAVVVLPEWRRVGLGTALLDRIESAARARGITRLDAVYLPDNERIVSLLERVGYTPQGIDGGLGTATKDLTAQV